VVAVLGYSSRRGDGLHRLCEERLRHAESLVAHGDAVLLSGWGRRRDGTGEAELMRAAWKGPDVPLISDGTARTTIENAREVAETARRLGATEVTVVTSSWHARRASRLVRAALPGVTVTTSSPHGRAPVSMLVRELACDAAVPYHVLRLRARPR